MKKLILISALLFSFNGWADEIVDPFEGFATPVEDDRPPIVFPESSFGGVATPEYDLDGDGVITLSEYHEARSKEEEDMVFEYQTLNECMMKESRECKTEACVALAINYCQKDVRYPFKPKN